LPRLQGTARLIANGVALVAGLLCSSFGLYLGYIGLDGGQTSGAAFIGAIMFLLFGASCFWLLSRGCWAAETQVTSPRTPKTLLAFKRGHDGVDLWSAHRGQ
jgi:hypothetical protein